jgi:2-polyprenyl-6-methoxyphenol hydroxylase-like FAD-dependent oxidoreductase
MSPVGAQGINIALRDAIVAANHLVPVLRRGGSRSRIAAALDAIEAERMPEVGYIQALQVQPPRLLLSHAWWGEPLRALIGLLLRSTAIRRRAGGRAAPFLNGVTDVSLTV